MWSLQKLGAWVEGIESLTLEQGNQAERAESVAVLGKDLNTQGDVASYRLVRPGSMGSLVMSERQRNNRTQKTDVDTNPRCPRY